MTTTPSRMTVREQPDTVEVLLDGIPRIGVLDDGEDRDPTLVLWAENGDALLSVSLAEWIGTPTESRPPGAVDNEFLNRFASALLNARFIPGARRG